MGRALTPLSTSSAGEPRALRMPRHGSHATRINGLMVTWVVGWTGRMGQWYGRVRGLLLLLPLATHGLRPQQRSLSLTSDAPHNTSTTVYVETPSDPSPPFLSTTRTLYTKPPSLWFSLANPLHATPRHLNGRCISRHGAPNTSAPFKSSWL